jgi:ATP-binding cassette, subfamily B, multidrug efflux pump
LKLLLTFFRRFLRHRRNLSLGVLCVPLAQAADVQITLMIGATIGSAKNGELLGTPWGVLGIIGALALAHCVLRFFQRWLIVVVSRRFEVELKQQLFDKLTSLTFAFHNRSRSGDVVSRVTSDVENLRMFLGPGLMYVMGAIVIVPLALGVLFMHNPGLTLTMILPMIAMGGIMRALTPGLHKRSTAVQESLADISHRAQENFGGIRVVKGYNREEQQAGRFTRTSEENRDNQVALGRARGLTHAAINGSFDLTFFVILIIGGLAAVNSTLPLEDLFIFIDLTIKVFWPLIALGWILGMYPRAVASAERVTELLAEQPEIHDAPNAIDWTEPRGELEFDNVSFAYGEDHAPALQNISVTAPAGSTLGIVGPTGSGKTTLLHLIGRMFEPEGTLRLDGHDVRELTLASLRGALGYVPQDSFLFSLPYHENIRFGADRDLTDAEVESLIERASMTDEVADFPNGIEQLVGERGVTLSGGQRQRTCIARALARDPKVLILDDCVSAVDTETEQALLGSLRDAGEGRTVIVAAHRLSTVMNADTILVLTENGEVEATGNHNELIAADGWYASTWEQQQRRESLDGDSSGGPA